MTASCDLSIAGHHVRVRFHTISFFTDEVVLTESEMMSPYQNPIFYKFAKYNFMQNCLSDQKKKFLATTFY